MGCYIESSLRELDESSYSSSTNTVEGCIQFCRANSYIYSGLQAG